MIKRGHEVGNKEEMNRTRQKKKLEERRFDQTIPSINKHKNWIGTT